MESLVEFRKRKDEFFKAGEDSPIPAEDRSSFTGLKYFPKDPTFKFEVSLAGVPEEALEFETSSGEKKTFKRIGKLGFTVAGQPAELTLYQAESGSYFLPFRDATSGNETYGAGRYLEVEEKDGQFELNFNYAYNPYCAYTEGYSCPLPPLENWLKVPIRAGEKNYK
ncbi:MAG: DUF1684 domain-containing protein [Patescibacteria group bacterium]